MYIPICILLLYRCSKCQNDWKWFLFSLVLLKWMMVVHCHFESYSGRNIIFKQKPKSCQNFKIFMILSKHWKTLYKICTNHQELVVKNFRVSLLKLHKFEQFPCFYLFLSIYEWMMIYEPWAVGHTKFQFGV